MPATTVEGSDAAPAGDSVSDAAAAGSRGDVHGAVTVRVQIVDDEALVRSGLSMILGAADGISVVGACEGTQALDMVRKHRPDVLLLDIRMPVIDGLAVLRQVRAEPSPPAIAMLTTFSADSQVAAALREGARGFLLKDSEPEDLVAAVSALARGGSVLSPRVTGTVVAGFLAGHADADAQAAVSLLSSRERDVLVLLGDGLSNVDIARRLFLSVPTVKEHVSAILVKLHVDNRVQAAVVAHKARLDSRS